MINVINKIVAIFVILILAIYSHTNAQVSYGGKPYFNSSLPLINSPSSTKQLNYTPTSVQLKGIINQKSGQPLTFAHQFTVNYTPQNSGSWEIMEDGTKVWRILINSPGAYSINIIFDRFKLPEGAKLFIYNTDFSEVIGSFTNKNNKSSGILATAPVAGDQIIVEYQEPAKVDFKGELLIGAVNHDFFGIHKLTTLKAGVFGDAGDCNIDVSCYDDENKLDIKRAVGRLIVNGTDLCTATLINNTAQDGTPYLISAAHCFKNDKDGSSTLLCLNYEAPYCSGNIEGTKLHTVSGGETKVFVDSMDIALVKLTEMPPAYYRPYYAGWTLNSSPSKPFKIVHHPQGDVKKISTTLLDLVPVTFYTKSGYPPDVQFVSDFHWLVKEWTTGTTEAGSSGGPLFDINNRIVGTLSGGLANCTSPKTDYFTRFYKAWDLNSQIDGQFAHWLDPGGTGNQSVVGLDPYENAPFTRLTNVEVGEVKEVSKLDEGGYMSGHNSLGSTLFAERFEGIKSAVIKGVYIMPGKSSLKSVQTIDLIVWEGINAPENVVARKNGIALNELRSNKEGYLEFANLVNVEGSFYVGYEINYSGSPIDTFAVYHSSNEGKLNNTMMVYSNDSWEYASELYDGINKSLWIDVLANSVAYGDTQIISNNDTNIILFPNPTNDDYIYINSKKLLVENYEIISMSGYPLQYGDINLASSDIPIYVADIPQGMYILKLLVEGKYKYYKFIKQYL